MVKDREERGGGRGEGGGRGGESRHGVVEERGERFVAQ